MQSGGSPPSGGCKLQEKGASGSEGAKAVAGYEADARAVDKEHSTVEGTPIGQGRAGSQAAAAKKSAPPADPD